MDILLSPLQLIGTAFILTPFLAFIPSIFFGFFYFKTKQRFTLILTILWLLYGMKLRILCGGECNIRIDLLLIYPLLLIMSFIAIIKIVRWYKHNR